MIEILNFLNSVWPYLVAILLFLILIFIHEFGHFISAKLLGVRVNEFAVGFGPKIFSKKAGDTEYSLKLVPLGGYCAMEGEDEDSTDDRAFCNKPAWRRFLIVVMGAVFNLLLGFIIVAISLSSTTIFATTKVAELPTDTKSYQSGLRAEDTILKVDGRKIYSFMDLGYAFTNVKEGKVDLVVERNGKKTELKNVQFKTEKEQDISYITIDFKFYGERKTFGSYIKNTFKTSASYCAVIWRSLADLIGGKYGLSVVTGPVGTTTVIADMAKENLNNLLPIMALISINLGIFNLLPIPALDGGRLIFILYEMITRKRVPQKYEAVVHAIGFVLLMGFMALIMVKDVLGLII